MPLDFSAEAEVLDKPLDFSSEAEPLNITDKRAEIATFQTEAERLARRGERFGIAEAFAGGVQPLNIPKNIISVAQQIKSAFGKAIGAPENVQPTSQWLAENYASKIEPLIPVSDPEKRKGIAKGIIENTAGLIENPEYLAAIGAGMATGPVGGATVAGGFLKDMVEGATDSWNQASEAEAAGDKETAARLKTASALNALMGLGIVGVPGVKAIRSELGGRGTEIHETDPALAYKRMRQELILQKAQQIQDAVTQMRQRNIAGEGPVVQGDIVPVGATIPAPETAGGLTSFARAAEPQVLGGNWLVRAREAQAEGKVSQPEKVSSISPETHAELVRQQKELDRRAASEAVSLSRKLGIPAQIETRIIIPETPERTVPPLTSGATIQGREFAPTGAITWRAPAEEYQPPMAERTRLAYEAERAAALARGEKPPPPPEEPPPAAPEPPPEPPKPTVPSDVAAMVKEPWQMTSEEYAKAFGKWTSKRDDGKTLVSLVSPEGIAYVGDVEHSYLAEELFRRGVVKTDPETGIPDLRGWEATFTRPNGTSFRAHGENAEFSNKGVEYIGGRQHRAAIEQALGEGKPVPDNVLAEYPDLQPKPTAPAPLSVAEQAAERERLAQELEGGDVNAKEAQRLQEVAQPQPEPGETQVPTFAKRYDPETLFSRPTWVEPGSNFDKALGETRDSNDTFHGVDITGIWKSLTRDQRQELYDRGWTTEVTRTPGQIVLRIAQDAIAARKYYGVQAKRKLMAQPEPGQQPAPAPAKEPELMRPDVAEMDFERAASVYGDVASETADVISNSAQVFRRYRATLENAVSQKRPVNAYGWTQDLRNPMPEGYVREGDRYVFKGEPKPAAPAAETRGPSETTRSSAQPGVDQVRQVGEEARMGIPPRVQPGRLPSAEERPLPIGASISIGKLKEPRIETGTVTFIGTRLKRLMEDLGVTEDQVADSMGVSVARVRETLKGTPRKGEKWTDQAIKDWEDGIKTAWQKPTKAGGPNALEKRSAEKVDVGERAEAGPQVGGQVRQPEGPSGARGPEPKGKETPVGQVKEVAKRRGISRRAVFEKETEMVGPDLMDWIKNEMPLLSKSGARRKRGPEWYKTNQSLWDDAPQLSRPHHNLIYSDSGSLPDVVAQAAYEKGLISEPSEGALWARIRTDSKARHNSWGVAREEAATLDKMAAFDEKVTEKTKGTTEKSTDELKIGDQFEVDNEPFKVTAIDADTGEVTIDDGRKFGRQILPDNKTIYVEKYVESPDVANQFPPSEPRPSELAKPKATPGQLFAESEVQFNLAGERLKAPEKPVESTTTYGTETLAQQEMFAVQKVISIKDPAKSANVAQEIAGGDPRKAAEMIENQMRRIDADVKQKRSWTPAMRAQVKEVVNVLRERARTPSSQALGIAPPGSDIAQRFIQWWKAEEPAGAPVPIKVDTTSVMPRAQPYRELKNTVARPQGVGTIPILGRLLDYRRKGGDPVKGAMSVNAWTKGVGENIARLIGSKYAWANELFRNMPQSDVIEAHLRDPVANPLTPEQTRAVHEGKAILDELLAWMADEGIPKAEALKELELQGMLDKGYWPRPALGRMVEGKLVTGLGNMGGGYSRTPSQLKPRTYKTEAEGVADDMVYEPDFASRLATTVARGWKAIANHRLINDPDLGGRTGTDPRFGYEGTIHHPAFQGKIFPQEIANQINARIAPQVHKFWDIIHEGSSLAKSFKLSLDWSAPMVQGLPVLFWSMAKHNNVWGRAVAASARAWTNPEYLRTELAKPGMYDAASEFVQLGGSLGRLEDYMASAQKGGPAARLPYLGTAFERAGASFGAFLDMAKLYLWRAVRETTPRAEWHQAVEAVENSLGSARRRTTGEHPGITRGLDDLVLAPSYYLSAPNLLANLIKNNASGKLSREVVGYFGAGVLLTAIGGMFAAGLSKDEIKQKLIRGDLTVPVPMPGGKKINVGYAHILTSLAKLSASTIKYVRDKDSIAELGKGGIEDNPLKRWMWAHSGPIPSASIEAITGRDFLGQNTSLLKTMFKQFMPISVSQLGETTKKEGLTTAVADSLPSAFGLNAYPQNYRQVYTELAEKEARKQFKSGYGDLSIPKQADVIRTISKDKRIAVKPESSRSEILAARTQEELRVKRISEMLPAQVNEILSANSLRIRGYDPILNLRGAQVYLTKNQQDKYESFIASEYSELFPKVAKFIEKAPTEKKQEIADKVMEKARATAKAKLISASIQEERTRAQSKAK